MKKIVSGRVTVIFGEADSGVLRRSRAANRLLRRATLLVALRLLLDSSGAGLEVGLHAQSVVLHSSGASLQFRLRSHLGFSL